MPHLATIWSGHDLEPFSLLKAGQHAQAQEAIDQANWPLGQFRSKIVGRTGGEVNVIKAALELCGRTGEASRIPMRCLTEDERNELGELLHG